MILLDTNVIYEVVRDAPDPSVAAWMRAQARHTLVTSVVVQAEILYGRNVMAGGRMRRHRVAMIDAVFAEIGTVLPVTSEAAIHYAQIATKRREAGKPLAGFDGLIAAATVASPPCCARKAGG